MQHPFEAPFLKAARARGETALDALVDDDIRARIAHAHTGLGPYGYDSWGGSKVAAERTLAIARWFYRTYFRCEAYGTENVPEGRSLIIGNHAGQLPIDGVLAATALMLDRDPPKLANAMIERFFAGIPFLNVFFQRTGQHIGLPRHCERLLEKDDAAVLVFPEGVRGSGKVFWDRYKLMGFGQGFMRLAMRTKSPIVPFGFVGSEEMSISFSKMMPLARAMGLPYVPLTPTLLPLPLPVKCVVRFGQPLFFEGDGNEPDEVVLANVRQVERAVESLLEQGLETRSSVFSR